MKIIHTADWHLGQTFLNMTVKVNILYFDVASRASESSRGGWVVYCRRFV